MNKTPFIILICILISACSTPYFHSTKGENTAKISFSNQMPNTPDLFIKINCQSFHIGKNNIDKRSPKTRAVNVLQIPSGKEISLYFENTEFVKTKTVSATHFSHESGYPLGQSVRIYPKEQMTFDTCSNSITFTPQKDKNYEVYYGTTNDNKCHIIINEVTNSLTSNTKKFKSIEANTSPTC